MMEKLTQAPTCTERDKNDKNNNKKKRSWGISKVAHILFKLLDGLIIYLLGTKIDW